MQLRVPQDGSGLRSPKHAKTQAPVAVGPAILKGQHRWSALRAAAVAAPEAPPRPRPATTLEDLNDPCHIHSAGHSTVRVKDHAVPISLDQYMQLPIEQYFIISPNMIKHLSGNRFLLQVPRIKIFNIWIEPEVEVSVTTQPGGSDGTPPKVILQAQNCRIRGSEAIENWRIDQRFCMQFTTELTWVSHPETQQQTHHQHQHHEGQMALEPGQQGTAADAAVDKHTTKGTIRGDARVDVWCEVIKPFHLMPRSVLQATCNGVLFTLVNSLLPLFVRQLAADYERWATEPEYRAERAARSKPLDAAELALTHHN